MKRQNDGGVVRVEKTQEELLEVLQDLRMKHARMMVKHMPETNFTKTDSENKFPEISETETKGEETLGVRMVRECRERMEHYTPEQREELRIRASELLKESQNTNNREKVFNAINEERDYQDAKWGTIEQKKQSVEGYLLILEAELNEAKNGWLKNLSGRHSVLAEIKQIAATAVACLEQYGLEDTPL